MQQVQQHLVHCQAATPKAPGLGLAAVLQQLGRSQTAACGARLLRWRSSTASLPAGARPPWQPPLPGQRRLAAAGAAAAAVRGAWRLMCGMQSGSPWRSGELAHMGWTKNSWLHEPRAFGQPLGAPLSRGPSATQHLPDPPALPPSPAHLPAATAGCCRRALRGRAAAAAHLRTLRRPHASFTMPATTAHCCSGGCAGCDIAAIALDGLEALVPAAELEAGDVVGTS